MRTLASAILRLWKVFKKEKFKTQKIATSEKIIKIDEN